MNWLPLDSWIVAVGALTAIACALPGCFLFLRQMSMMGDAISHAVLPGLAIAFLITGSRASIGMFIGAALVGVLTALFTQWISKFGNVDRGAAMGVVFTTLFALGLLLIVRAANHVDLDPGCVLYGAIELTPLDQILIAVGPIQFQVPRAVLTLSCVTILNLAFILTFYKELKLSAFDPSLATTLGFNATLMHYLLMTIVAITTVAAFEAVGSIIVIAMLIVPAASAHLLTDRLPVMLVLAAALAAASAAVGHLSALLLPPLLGFSATSTSGMMAVVAGVVFLATAVLAPRYGLLRKLFNDNRQRFTKTINKAT